MSSSSLAGTMMCPCCKAELVLGLVLAAKNLPLPEHEDELVKEEEPPQETHLRQDYPPPRFIHQPGWSQWWWISLLPIRPFCPCSRLFRLRHTCALIWP